MSFAREAGFAIRQYIENPDVKNQICEKLGYTEHELDKLLSGRLFMTGSDLDVIADACGTTADEILSANIAEYDANVVHCMTDFTNRQNREMILDLIDTYIDMREALADAVHE